MMQAARRSTRSSAAPSEDDNGHLKTPARGVEAAPPASSSDTSAAVNTVTPADTATTAAKEQQQQAEVSLSHLEQQEASSNTASASASAGAKHVRFGQDDANHEMADEKKEPGGSSEQQPSSLKESSAKSSSQRGFVSRRGGRFAPPGLRQTPVFRSPPRQRSDAGAEGEVPSLCSTNSGQLVTATTQDKEKESSAAKTNVPASSISCDPSTLVNASPLASHGTEEGKTAAAKANQTNDSSKPAQALSKATPTAENTKKDRKNPQIPYLEDDDKASGAPSGTVQPSLKQPLPTAPSRRVVTGSASFEEKKTEPLAQKDEVVDKKPSPKRDRNRDHYVTTPTDFALDYGKGQQVSASFDTSNVLAWLQSPTANGLFSPGGYGSIMNTPSRGAAPRTPRTPTVSTSFFFSDVAGLPRSSNESTPHGDSARRSKNGIICISPLSAAKARNGALTGATPVNDTTKDLFGASPKDKSGRSVSEDATPSRAPRPRGPQRTGSKDPSLDAALAERDLMEDEDLSVLLQLASNTPRSAERGAAAVAGSQVFRSPAGKRKSGGAAVGQSSSENLPALQLPMIGGRDGKTAAARLSRKPDQADAEDFAPPQLGMRSGSSNGSKEIYVSGGKAGANAADSKSDAKDKGSPKKMKGPSPYMMPPPYPPHPGHEYYPPMPPASMPPGATGSMRVAIGGPPPPRKGVAGTPPRHPAGAPSVGGSPHAPPPHYADPYAVHYGPPGMYPPHYPPQHMGMGGYPPYQGHYPPPPHGPMPMYGAQQAASGPDSAKKKAKSKSGVKRASPLLDKGGKKPKKASNGPKKIKNRSPQITDSVEREKAAAAIKAVNAASGGKNDKAAALAAAIMRGVTMRPSGKWQAQLYFAGKSRYIGVFDTREKAALAYEIAREKLKNGSQEGEMCPKSTENLVNAARKAAFEGVNEKIKNK